MADDNFDRNERAKEIVDLRDREYAKQSNFRSLWQSTSDLTFPQTLGITKTLTPGEQLMTNLFDTTGVEEAENTSSNIVSSLFPPGQKFFAITVPQYLKDDQSAREYLPYMEEQTHEQMFNTNFIAQVANTIHYWFVFGIAALYTDWTVRLGLNYRDYAIGSYQCIENEAGIIDTILLTCPMTAAQIVEKFVSDDESVVGKTVHDSYYKPKSRHDRFNIIHYIGPRRNYDPNPVLRDVRVAPVESTFVAEKDKHLIRTGGYDEFPFAIPRYSVIYSEVYGRGRGTMMLPRVRQLNRRAKDYDEMSNKWVRPPLQILDTFDGVVNLAPAAQNFVSEANAIMPIEMGASGASPITKDILEYYREGVREGFLHSAFEPITQLKGDRRNIPEIVQRISEGIKKQARPFGRLFTELLPPVIVRTIRLLVRNGVIQPPPDSLAGSPLKIEFINPLALALRDQQARGGQRTIAIAGEASQIFPDITDNFDYDKWIRDTAEAYGMKADHIRPVRDRDGIRQQRAQQKQQMEQLAAAQAMAEGYSKTTKAPEPGSPFGGEVE